MSFKFTFLHVEAQTVLTDVEALNIVVTTGKGRVIPSITFVLTKLDRFDGLELSVLFVCQKTLHVHTLMLIILLMLSLLFFTLFRLFLQGWFIQNSLI